MQNLSPRAPNPMRWLGLLLALGYFLLCVAWVKSVPASWNDISRVAAIESLAERGTWVIEESPWFELTMDKAFLNGQFYSDKTPLLSWAAAGVYSILYRLGFSLSPECVNCAYPILTLVFVSLPAASMIAMMFYFARAQNVTLIAAVIGTLVLALGTMILPYSLVLNHNLPGAVSLFAGFFLLAAIRNYDTYRLLGAGCCAALAISFEPLAGIGAAALFGWSLFRFRAQSLYFMLGALPPLALTMLLDLQFTGTILPPYLVLGAYDYPDSFFLPTIGGNSTSDDIPQYTFKMLLGARGLFAYNPTLLFGLVGLGLVALTPKHPLRMGAIFVGIVFTLLTYYLATQTYDLGGEAYGERWFMQMIPLVMAFLFFAPPLSAQGGHWRWLVAPFFVIALVAAIFSTYQGARKPWRYVPPPAHPTRDAATGALGWKWEIQVPWR